MAPRVPPIKEALAKRFQRNSDNECWPWTAYENIYGYGQFYHGGSYHPAHRVVYEQETGPIPAGMSVLHRCDNPICVNPNHLFLGTQAENVQDCIKKGRNNRGERNGMAKLNAELVSEIRKAYEEGIGGYMKLGKRFGLPSGTIRNVIKRKRWSHL
jgi:hypothetical protein